MSQRYTVMALDRSSIGHPNYHRAGRSWPSGQEVEVEVLDQDDDPMETITVKGEARTFPHPTRIGRVSWGKLVADKQLIKQPVGATVNEALALQAAYDSMKAELGRTVTRAEMAETVLAERNAVVDRLTGQVAELEAKVAQLTAKADEDATKDDDTPPLVPISTIAQPKGQPKGSTKRGG